MSASNSNDHELMMALHSAVIEENNLTEIKRLLDLGADVNARDDKNKNWTALHVAAFYDENDSHLSVLEILLKHGADVYAVDTLGNSILHFLVRENNVKSIELLLNFKVVDVNIKNIHHVTPLSQALCRSDFETIKLLIDRGADVNYVDNINQSTSLHHVFIGRNFDCIKVIKLLLINGADIEAVNTLGFTPFDMMLLIGGYTDKRLLKFSLNYARLHPVKPASFNILRYHKETENSWETILEHVAKLLNLDLTLDDPSILEFISKDKKYNDYFSKCLEELEVAKSTKLHKCWVTYFNLLVDNKIKLKNYAGNQDLINCFYESDCLKKFPIYGPEILEKVEKGIKKRKLFDDSTAELSKCLLIFNPTHLVIKDILDCLSFKDCEKFLLLQDYPISNKEVTFSGKRKIS